MNKVRKKFVVYAMAAVFALLTVLLAIINGINFTMASEDADRVTQMIAGGKGSFGQDGKEPDGSDYKAGPRIGKMGPDSPETPYSARFFTYRFDNDGNCEEIAFRISAFTREDAEALAERLKNERTGWTYLTYRYRVYREGDFTYVTVVDQGREMLPCYRILIISVIGELIGLGACLAFLIIMSRRVTKPIEDADRKQRKFISEAENGFKVPLTVINASAEVIEKENGPSEYTGAIRRQVKRMTELTKQLGAFAIIEEDRDISPCDLSLILLAAADSAEAKAAERGIKTSRDILPDVRIDGNEEALRRAVSELCENALKFALSFIDFSLSSSDGHTVLSVSNDTSLPDGDADQAFDRFTRLENASGVPGSGLGLSYVKDVVKAHNGRLSASVSGGAFTVRITF